jgi:multicomponent Na+:H+ antiporter subunit B
MRNLIAQTAVRLLTPLLLLYSLFLVCEGHHQPGGGFSGGLIAAAVVGLCAFLFDAETARQVLPVRPHVLIGVGLLTAAGSGILSFLDQRPFLTGLWVSVPMAGGGEVAVGTPLLFDVGVYLVVIGVTSMILLALAEE